MFVNKSDTRLYQHLYRIAFISFTQLVIKLGSSPSPFYRINTLCYMLFLHFICFTGDYIIPL